MYSDIITILIKPLMVFYCSHKLTYYSKQRKYWVDHRVSFELQVRTLFSPKDWYVVTTASGPIRLSSRKFYGLEPCRKRAGKVDTRDVPATITIFPPVTQMELDQFERIMPPGNTRPIPTHTDCLGRFEGCGLMIEAIPHPNLLCHFRRRQYAVRAVVLAERWI